MMSVKSILTLSFLGIKSQFHLDKQCIPPRPINHGISNPVMLHPNGKLWSPGDDYGSLARV